MPDSRFVSATFALIAMEIVRQSIFGADTLALSRFASSRQSQAGARNFVSSFYCQNENELQLSAVTRG
jgi:hypothetical protein